MQTTGHRHPFASDFSAFVHPGGEAHVIETSSSCFAMVGLVVVLGGKELGSNGDPQELQRQLDDAIGREDYQSAAELRDSLREEMESGVRGVLDANAAFYRAFQTADMAAMAEVWGDGEGVQVIHPVAGCIAGRDLVLASWEIVLSSGAAMDISLHSVRAAAAGR